MLVDWVHAVMGTLFLTLWLGVALIVFSVRRHRPRRLTSPARPGTASIR